MTVKELIDKLKNMNQDSEVCITDQVLMFTNVYKVTSVTESSTKDNPNLGNCQVQGDFVQIKYGEIL